MYNSDKKTKNDFLDDFIARKKELLHPMVSPNDKVSTEGLVQDTLDTKNSFFNTLRDILTRYKEYKSTSLSEFTKKSQINSRLFIQNSLAHESILTDIIHTVYDMYAGFVLTATELNTYVTQSKTIDNFTELVSTEGITLDGIDHISIDTQIALLNGTESIGEHDCPVRIATEANDGVRHNSPFVEKKGPVNIPSGKVLRLTFKTSDGATVSTNMTLTLFPRFILEDTAKQFISLQVPSSNRWKQYRAGEISFWRDFIFEIDHRKKNVEELKKDKENVLFEMFSKKNESLLNRFSKLIGFSPTRQNIANTVLVVEKSTLETALNYPNNDFTSESNRDKFFKSSMCLMLVVVDINYSEVSFYYNSLPNYGTYTFAQMSAAANSNKYGLVDIMEAFTKGNSPKF